MNETPPPRGIAFPFRVVGHVRAAEGPEKLKQNLRQLLSTRLSERVMLRDYGGGVHRRVQEPNDGTLRALIAYEIEQALVRYMPEVVLVAPPRLRASGPELFVELEYRVGPATGTLELEIR
jgi:phage baseplate assembly protein W